MFNRTLLTRKHKLRILTVFSKHSHEHALKQKPWRKLFQFWVKTNLQHINDVFIVFSHALLLTFPYIYGDI